jgi:hypothetical protein
MLEEGRWLRLVYFMGCRTLRDDAGREGRPATIEVLAYSEGVTRGEIED